MGGPVFFALVLPGAVVVALLSVVVELLREDKPPPANPVAPDALRGDPVF